LIFDLLDGLSKLHSNCFSLVLYVLVEHITYEIS
jgi:hypothetical protein